MTEPEFSAENVEKALYQLYFDPSVSTKDVAQQWLTKAQRANEAWKFAWTLLQPGKATEVQYFGASSLVSKISASWNDVVESDVHILRDHLYEQLLYFCQMPEKRIVLTRLCVAFSSFVINCVIRNMWTTALSDIIEKLQTTASINSGNHNYLALLEILTVLPEEYQTSHLDKYKRGIVMNMLRDGMSQITRLLKSLFQVAGLKLKVINCLSSWISLGTPMTECEDLLLNILECVKQPEFFEKSIECMLNAFCSPILSEYPETVKKFVPIILSMQPMLEKAIEEQDCENILGLTKLICSLAENQTKIIVNTCTDPQCGLGLINLVMICTNVPLQYPTDEVSSPISFTFWYSLQDELQALSAEENMQVRQHVLPFFYQLLNVLLRKASYPTDNSHNGWSADEKEQHRIYRIDISDTLMYVLEMLGIQVLLFIFEQFKTCLQDPSTMETRWHGIETCLFGIHSIVETLTETDTEIPCLSSLAQVLPQIPISSIQLADTVLYTVGTLTEWLSRHPEHLRMLLQLVVPCISNNDLSLSAVLTMRRITRECAEHMGPYAGNLMEQISNVFMQGTLRTNEESWLMQSAGYILSIMPEEEYVQHVERLLMLHIHQLDALSKEDPSPPNKNSILRILDLLTNLFSTLDRRKRDEDGEIIQTEVNKNQHVIVMLEQLMPIFKEILNHWVRDSTVVQTLCSLYNKAIRTLVSAFKPLLHHLCEMLSTLYQAYPYYSVLDLAQQITLVFGSDPQELETVAALLQVIMTTSMKVFENRIYVDHPDIAHGFMYLMSVVCRKQAELFHHVTKNGKPSTLDIFHCGILTLSMPDTESAKAGSNFVIELLGLYQTDSTVAASIEKSGKELTKVTLKAIGGQSPRTCMDNFADILFCLSKIAFESFNRWMTELLAQPDIPNTKVEVAKRNTFHKQLLREVKSKRKYRDTVKDFALICRGLHGTEYANGT
uniref:Importin-13-like n=1 Tax=Phallusia mammillata TaxID=59560 RepID=A0A6F9DFH0_9ASCI|nr:importin-13-like [Phallusia mammillata]